MYVKHFEQCLGQSKPWGELPLLATTTMVMMVMILPPPPPRLPSFFRSCFKFCTRKVILCFVDFWLQHSEVRLLRLMVHSFIHSTFLFTWCNCQSLLSILHGISFLKKMWSSFITLIYCVDFPHTLYSHMTQVFFLDSIALMNEMHNIKNLVENISWALSFQKLDKIVFGGRHNEYNTLLLFAFNFIFFQCQLFEKFASILAKCYVERCHRVNHRLIYGYMNELTILSPGTKN